MYSDYAQPMYLDKFRLRSGKGKTSGMLLDKEGTLKRIKGDRVFLRELYTAFLDEMPLKRRRLDDAMRRHDYETIAYIAHTLAGAAAAIGARSCRQYAITLEKVTQSRHIETVEAALRDLEGILQKLQKVLEKECQAETE
jgi:HPt (histidine-containing phosphotransfer) domain-containing protein